ncbi:hypothetical protein KW787_00390 [Candidatus Pacearchaeota archaeon]|nr:hypothetical protein [Candidatus Pacearchaeota archaeon]
MAEEKATWVKMKPAELEKIVVELTKKGESPAKIGLILRDQHGIPKAKLVGKKIGKIITSHGLSLKAEKEIVLEKIEKIKSHTSRNKHDHAASRAITKQLWALHRLDKK